MEEYLADILHRIGVTMNAILQMTRPGYFLLIIKLNSRSKLLIMQFTIDPMLYVISEEVLILSFR